MTLKVEIYNMDGAAFEGLESEIGSILYDLRRKILEHRFEIATGESVTLRDHNGNACGIATVQS